ncbi:MAG: hypothetical protein ACXAB4_06770 [Candidatus Hodarchaeales archaeon]|jgi:hypothetical protein
MKFGDEHFWVNTLGATLENWEIIVRDICLGLLISGIMLFLMTVFLQGMHLFDHDADIGADHDISADSDFGVDHDVSVDHDIGVDSDIGVDHDIAMDHDLGGDFGGDYGTPAPMLLLAATFMLIAGALGTSLYSLGDSIDSFARLGAVIAFPLFCTFLVSWAWGKVAKSSLIELEIDGVRANDDVVALTNVDESGGLVRAQYTSSEGETGQIKLPAKSLPGVIIPKGRTAYVIDKQGSMLLIDEWPNPAQEENSKKK